MKKLDTKSINGIGWVVAFIWLILMFTVGVTPSQAEINMSQAQKDAVLARNERINNKLSEKVDKGEITSFEAKQEAKVEFVRVYNFNAEISSIKNLNGQPLPEYKDDNLDSFFVIGNAHNGSSVIEIEIVVSVADSGRYVGLEHLDVNDLFIDNRNSYTKFSSPKIVGWNLDTGILRVQTSYIASENNFNNLSCDTFRVLSRDEDVELFNNESYDFVSYYDKDNSDRYGRVEGLDEYISIYPSINISNQYNRSVHKYTR